MDDDGGNVRVDEKRCDGREQVLGSCGRSDIIALDLPEFGEFRARTNSENCRVESGWQIGSVENVSEKERKKFKLNVGSGCEIGEVAE